jgi:hypothetical protein
MCRHLREPGHRDIGGRCALDDRYYHPRGKEGKGRQKTDMAFDPAFSLSDFGEGGGATFHEIIDPTPCLRDRGKQRIAALRAHGRPRQRGVENAFGPCGGRFLEMALQGQPEGSRLGEFITTNCQNTHAAYIKLGTLKGAEAATGSYTEEFLAACNDFDRAAVVAQAKSMKQ